MQDADCRPGDYHKGPKVRSAFLDRGLLAVSRVLKNTYVQWDLSARDGLLQRLDPRLKLLFLAFFVVAISLKKDISSEFIIAFVLFCLAVLSKLCLIPLYLRVAGFSSVFGLLLSFPSALNVIVPGTLLFPFFTFDRSYDFLFYHIPQAIGVTKEGLYHVVLLSLRVANSLTVCLIVMSTTRFPDLAKALRFMRVPDIVVVILALFHKYLFILSSSLEQMHLAMRSRVVSSVPKADARLWAAGRMGCLYHKSRQGCEEVFRAMLSRGFTGEIRLTQPLPLDGANRLAGFIFLSIWMVIILL